MTRPDTERAIRAACDGGDYNAAATLALEGYGPEILGFLLARLRDESEAAEAFSLFSEDLWRGLPGFGWRSTVRVWCFILARHASARYARERGRLARRQVPMSQVGRASEIAEKVRATTLPYLRTQVKSQMRALFEKLPEEDQTVLTLRIDRQLSFREIAEILAGEAGPLAGGALTREAARLRKRFQLAKEQLRRMAEAEGILG